MRSREVFHISGKTIDDALGAAPWPSYSVCTHSSTAFVFHYNNRVTQGTYVSE